MNIGIRPIVSQKLQVKSSDQNNSNKQDVSFGMKFVLQPRNLTKTIDSLLGHEFYPAKIQVKTNFRKALEEFNENDIDNVFMDGLKSELRNREHDSRSFYNSILLKTGKSLFQLSPKDIIKNYSGYNLPLITSPKAYGQETASWMRSNIILTSDTIRTGASKLNQYMEPQSCSCSFNDCRLEELSVDRFKQNLTRLANMVASDTFRYSPLWEDAEKLYFKTHEWLK